jgi:predicted nucleic acid-binding protein
LRKLAPSPAFAAWFQRCDEDLLYLSAITLGELRFGIDLLPDGKRKQELLTWYADVCLSYRGSIVSPSLAACERWGIMRAQRRRDGSPLSMADGLIAAIVRTEGMTLVTRNTDDFYGLGIDLLNPWLA